MCLYIVWNHIWKELRESDPDPHPDPDPWDPYVFGPPRSASGSNSQRYRSGFFYHQAKIVRKSLIPTVLLLLYDFLSLRNDVNVAAKSKKQNAYV
jgi:hypothetical protein